MEVVAVVEISIPDAQQQVELEAVELEEQIMFLML
jgi:hypothetical protein